MYTIHENEIAKMLELESKKQFAKRNLNKTLPMKTWKFLGF